MPVYEMRCLNCGWEIEVTQKITDEPHEFIRHPMKGSSKLNKLAPRSGTVCSGQMKRLISKTTFSLKGGGWGASGYSS